jgi:hypothetical protein
MGEVVSHTDMPAGQVLRHAAEAGIIPPAAPISRKGEATWRADGRELLARVERQSDRMLSWHTYVGDAKLGPAMAKFGRLAVRIEPASGEVIDWTQRSGLSDEVLRYLREGIGASLHFVVDRADLAQILASEHDIRRGGLSTWLPRGSYPARLVEALILARDMGR